MSNALTTVSSSVELSFARTSKAGKVTTRGLLGLMTSGNKAERASAADLLVHHQWATGQFKPILSEIIRVFGGKSFAAVAAALQMDMQKPNKANMVGVMRSLVNGTAGQALKGEKALYRGYAADLVIKYDADVAAKLAEVAQTALPAPVQG